MNHANLVQEGTTVLVIGAAPDWSGPSPQRLAPVRLSLVALQQVQVVHEGDAVPENGAPHLLHVVLRHSQEGGTRDVVLAEGLGHVAHVDGHEVFIHHLVDRPFCVVG